MKRLNPETGLPFKRGDVRADGYVFTAYETNKKPDRFGFYHERWASADKFVRDDAIKKARETAHPQCKSNRLSQIARHARTSAKKRGQACTIILADVIALWDRQQGLCAYTGWQMDFTTRSEQLVSIERIDNNIGYTPDNILLVCWCVNRARGGMTQQRFFEMCKSVVGRLQTD